MSPPGGRPQWGQQLFGGEGRRGHPDSQRSTPPAHLVAGMAERSGAPRGPELAGGSRLSDLGEGVFLIPSTSSASLNSGSVKSWTSLRDSPLWFMSMRSALSWLQVAAGQEGGLAWAGPHGAASAAPPGSGRRSV